ncbi:hypothetical protein HBB04_00195 [Pseudomonas coronafaciens]|nr:hypothetical protein HBB04_00195 [Pseudomonas coronafaciens]
MYEPLLSVQYIAHEGPMDAIISLFLTIEIGRHRVSPIEVSGDKEI